MAKCSRCHRGRGTVVQKSGLYICVHCDRADQDAETTTEEIIRREYEELEDA